MVNKAVPQINWRLQAFAAVGALIVTLPGLIGGNDVLAILGTIPVGLVVSVAILVVAFRKMRRRPLAVLSMLVVYCVCSWLLFKVAYDVHTAGRWLFQSKRYKADLLAQPEPPSGELKHVEWDVWGFAGVGDTFVYVVFDPKGLLAGGAKNHTNGKFNGIPCEVARIQRLESHWYTVQFYTDTNWDHCSSN